jgi:hypothetical protein
MHASFCSTQSVGRSMGSDHEPPQGQEVVVRAEQAHPPDGAVQDVVDMAAGRSAGCPGHGLVSTNPLVSCQTSSFPFPFPTPMTV